MKHTEQIHGGRIFEAARILGRPWTEIIDFSANINPLGQPRGLKQALFEDFERALHYPEVRAESLSARLADMTCLSADYFLPGAGSTPHLHLLPRALGMERPVIVGPAFAEYEAALARAGRRAEYVLTRERDDWQVTNETLDRIFKKDPNAVFLANPANPTGRLVPTDQLLDLAAECLRQDIWLVVDEAFIDFAEHARSMLTLVEKNPRVIVLRSLTKIFALPGLRLAFLAAHPEVMERMIPLVEPWILSSQAITAGHYCLSRIGFKGNTVKGIRIFRRQLVQELTALELGRVYPSEANFVLVKLRENLVPQALIDHLFQDGILLRDASNFYGLEPGFLRLAVRPVEEIAALTASLTRFLAGGR